MPFYMRSRGLAVKNMVGQVALIINMWVNPIALVAISYNYYILFLALNIMWLSLIFFFFHETKGYALEELVGMFDENAGVIEGVIAGKDVEHVSVQINNKIWSHLRQGNPLTSKSHCF